jgi:LmbE family N-acetylglucosaminyl deacetylase
MASSDLHIPIPNLLDARKILAVQPHYDDIDIPVGGTIAALAEAGKEIIYLTCTDDLMGVIDESWSDEEAAARLKQDQKDAAAILGVKRHYWLGYPDAGEYNYFDLRRSIMRVMRIESPDTILAIDPWSAYESHTDHIITGKATAEAAILCGLTKIKTDPEVDASYTPHHIERVAFYQSQYPNTCIDITGTLEKRRQAIRCYHAQFHQHELDYIADRVVEYAREKGKAHGYEFGELWKLVTTRHLHGYPDAWKY